MQITPQFRSAGRSTSPKVLAFASRLLLVSCSTAFRSTLRPSQSRQHCATVSLLGLVSSRRRFNTITSGSDHRALVQLFKSDAFGLQLVPAPLPEVVIQEADVGGLTRATDIESFLDPDAADVGQDVARVQTLSLGQAAPAHHAQ